MTDVSFISAATDPSLMAMKMAPTATLSLKMGAGATDARIEKTSQDFEAMFATEMLRPMFEGMDVDQTFGGGHGEEAMRSFMLQEYGKIIAKTGKLGVGSQVKAEMIRLQEGSGKGQSRSNATSAGASNAYQRSASGKSDRDVTVQ